MATHSCKLELTLEVASSPRQAGYFTLKSFGGLGEPEASLGELGSKKLNEKTLLPLFFGIFHVLDRNTEWFLALHCNWRSTCWIKWPQNN